MAVDFLLRASRPTLVLAPVVGSYLCLCACGLLRRGKAAEFLSDLRSHPASMHAVGAIAFLVGAGILSFNRHWLWPADILLNLVALWWAFEGAGMLADSDRLRAALGDRAAARLRTGQWGSLAIGLYLLLVGLSGTVG
jgi:hypothetical protein